MRKLIVISICVFSGLISNAQRVVALHGTSGVTVYSGVNPFIDAYNASVAGDTIYLPGGAFAAPTLIDKQLYVYGAGYHPDSTVATNPTLIGGGLNLGENSDHSHFEGVNFTNQVFTGYNVSSSFVTFKRCKLSGGINYQGDANTNFSSNNSFIECIINGTLSFVNLTNSSVMNSFIESILTDSKNNLFKNNIFSAIGVSWSGGTIHRPYYNEFINNIFLNSTAYFIYQGNDGNIFNYNIFVFASPSFGNNSISNGNYIGIPQGDIFINQSGNAFNYSDDYHLQLPSNYTDNSGVEVGLYGGDFPYKAGGVPLNPHISFKNISGTTNSNGELPIEININAQDH
jgi:hypothetical protein